MSRASTVVVLGAGASMPYGYPSGRELVLRCCEMLSYHDIREHQALREAGYEMDELEQFRVALMHWDPPSVDYFLEREQRYDAVGRAAIAAALWGLDVRPPLFPPNQPRGAWYRELTSKLDMERGFDWQSWPLAFVTFNFDRSLERYLTKVVQFRCHLSEEDAVAALESIPVHHVHGQLAPPWRRTARERGSPIARYVENSAGEIRLISDDIAASPVTQRVHDTISAAERILVVGCGMHPENFRRLGMPLVPNKASSEAGWYLDREVIVSTYGLSEEQSKAAIGRCFGGGSHVKWTSGDALSAISRHLLL